MKVLVMGGSGFIGSRVVQILCGAGYEVRVLSRGKTLKQDFRKGLVEHIRADLLDPDCPLERIISGCSVVFNCAGELREESRMEPLHVDATLRLIKTCKHMAKSSGQSLHWVQLSSVGAYGPSSSGASSVRVITEESSPAPVGAYEVTKTQADGLVMAAEEEGVFSYSILRPSNVYGAGMPNSSIRQWGRMVKRNLFFYVGAPGAVSTYVHVDDVVDALMLCGFDERAKGHIFNISNDCSLERVVSAMAKALRVPNPSLRLPEGVVRLIASLLSWSKRFPLSHSRIDALVSRTHYPVDKLDSVLGYRPTREVEKTITDVLFDEGGARK